MLINEGIKTQILVVNNAPLFKMLGYNALNIKKQSGLNKYKNNSKNREHGIGRKCIIKVKIYLNFFLNRAKINFLNKYFQYRYC